MESREIILRIQDFQNRFFQIKNPPNKETKTTFRLQVSKIIDEISKLQNEQLIEVSQAFSEMVRRCNLDEFFDSDIVYSYLASHIMAFALQINWHLDELSAQLGQIKQMIKRYLNLKNPHFFSFRSTSMRNKKQYLGKKAYLKLKFFLIYVETLLQHTAVLSQQGKHKDALEKASECFTKLKVELIRCCSQFF
jgi:hypothetical protein